MTVCCAVWFGVPIHSVVPPDDGPRYARNMYRLTKYTQNKLCNKLVFVYTTISRWAVNKILIFFLHTFQGVLVELVRVGFSAVYSWLP